VHNITGPFEKRKCQNLVYMAQYYLNEKKRALIVYFGLYLYVHKSSIQTMWHCLINIWPTYYVGSIDVIDSLGHTGLA